MKMLQKLGTFNRTFIYLLTTNFNQKTVAWSQSEALFEETESNLALSASDIADWSKRLNQTMTLMTDNILEYHCGLFRIF